MLKLKNTKGQNTAEYAILIALVIGGVISMQTYIQRGFQGRMRDATVFMRDETGAFGNSLQYEPYYVNQSAQVDRESYETETYAGQTSNDVRTRAAANFVQQTDYDASAIETITGLGAGGDF